LPSAGFSDELFSHTTKSTARVIIVMKHPDGKHGF
jgi:hypothetical protein